MSTIKECQAALRKTRHLPERERLEAIGNARIEWNDPVPVEQISSPVQITLI